MSFFWTYRGFVIIVAIGIITPLDFARYEEFPNDEVGKDEIEKMLEYFI